MKKGWNSLWLAGLVLPVLSSAQSRPEEEHRPIMTTHVVTNAEGVAPAATPLPVNLTLTGVANLDYKCALLKIRSGGEPAISVVLREGEARASVRVLQINTTNARVLVDNAGKQELLTLAGIAAAVVSEPDPDHRPIPAMPLPEDGER